MHDLISKHSSIQDSVNIESLATQNIAFRISDEISVNPNDVMHTAYNLLESESTTILGICQRKKGIHPPKKQNDPGGHTNATQLQRNEKKAKAKAKPTTKTRPE